MAFSPDPVGIGEYDLLSTVAKCDFSRMPVGSLPTHQFVRGKVKEGSPDTPIVLDDADFSALHPSAPMLQVCDLWTNILKSASFSLSAGEAIAVRGPSGAGKTLLLRAIADLDPNEGLVGLDGRDRSAIPGPEWRRLVGYVPAEPGWWADTVGEHFDEWKAALAFVSELGLPEAAKAWPIHGCRLASGCASRLSAR